MSGDNPRHPAVDDTSLRSISSWVRRYAEHRRGLAVAIGLFINLVLFGVIGGGAHLGGQAYRAGNGLGAGAGIFAAAAGCAVLFTMALTRAGRALPEYIFRRLAAQEGEVNLDVPTSRGKRRIAFWLGTAFGVTILAHVILGGTLPSQYQQPISALYVVPFLVGVWLLARPAVGYLSLLWPALYAIHAILLLSGAPILFTGRWEVMNMLLPIVGYGVLVNVVSHLYARFALHKVRHLSQMSETRP